MIKSEIFFEKLLTLLRILGIILLVGCAESADLTKAK